MWSVHERTLLRQDRINNYAEAHHRRLQNAFKCDHPPIWRFINKLREEQKQIDANLASFLAGRDPPPKKSGTGRQTGGFLPLSIDMLMSMAISLKFQTITIM